MIKVDHLEASKVDRGKQCGMSRSYWNAGPWGGNVGEEIWYDENGVVRTAEDTQEGDYNGGEGDAG